MSAILAYRAEQRVYFLSRIWMMCEFVLKVQQQLKSLHVKLDGDKVRRIEFTLIAE